MSSGRRLVRALIVLVVPGLLVSACGASTTRTSAGDAPPTLPSLGLTPEGLTPRSSTAPTSAVSATTTTTRAEPRPTDTPTVSVVVTSAPLATVPATTVPATTVPATTSVAIAPAPTLTLATRADDSPLTSCWAVMHVGDSTSVGMVSTGLLPDPARRIEAQYARVGVADIRTDAALTRAIKESTARATSGQAAAFAARQGGFRGCWVFALGTNDAANVSIGSDVGFDERIARMMNVAGDDPVLWVTAKTTTDDGAWADANMQRWNAALTQAAARYPSMRIYDWAAVAQESWFLSDGIHYNAIGYATRARLIADALARAFPG